MSWFGRKKRQVVRRGDNLYIAGGRIIESDGDIYIKGCERCGGRSLWTGDAWECNDCGSLS